MALVDDPVNGFCDYEDVPVANATDGLLAGLTLAVKDIYAVKGYPNGWGSPTRLAECEPDTVTQPCVQKMLDAGAQFVGKSHCDELCYSLNGVNAHYGAPINPRAPDRITGGSSSGSAALVASGAVDIATGSDTGGSVRAPAGYCGLVGLRTSHGRLSLAETMMLAPSFDVFGWFAKDIATYEKVGDVLLGDDTHSGSLTRAIKFSNLDELLLGDADKKSYEPMQGTVLENFSNTVSLGGFKHSVEDMYWCMRTLQGFEAWQIHKDWIQTSNPDLGPGVKDRFEWGAAVSIDQYEQMQILRKEILDEFVELLGDDGVIVMPTSPSAAPLRDATFDDLQAFREQALQLLCLSGLTGFPQITLPLGEVHDAPFGISLFGPRGSDRQLIALGKQVMTDRD